jgi:Cytochrome C oxidase, cbb3-type, subunit III
MILGAISATKAVLIGAASGAVLVLLAVAVAAGRRRPRVPPELDIPKGMRPGPSDPDLERPLLERHYVFGLVLLVAMALLVPVVWLQEPQNNKQDTELQLTQSVERGRLTTLPGNEENQMGFNCVRCHGAGLKGGRNFFNGSFVAVPNLTTVCGGAEFNHPLIKSLDDIVDTIANGRENTDMPSWSVRAKGAMDDQQINDIINYLLSIQVVPKDKNICLSSSGASG